MDNVTLKQQLEVTLI